MGSKKFWGGGSSKKVDTAATAVDNNKAAGAGEGVGGEDAGILASVRQKRGKTMIQVGNRTFTETLGG